MRGRFILGLTGASLLCAVVFGVMAYSAIAASRAQDRPAPAAIRAAFEDAARVWRSQIDAPVRRLVLASAEEYGSGTYLFVFDVYTWFGVGSGYATAGQGSGPCGGGGWITHAYGPGHVIVAP